MSAPKIGIGWGIVLALVAIGLVGIVAWRLSEQSGQQHDAGIRRDRLPRRQAVARDIGAIFDDPRDVRIEGDGLELVFYDDACTDARSRAYAVTQEIRDAMFLYVQCKNGTPIAVEQP